MNDEDDDGQYPSRITHHIPMRRIAIIGNAGGGKSTLARQLGAALAIPVYEIDLLQWKPGWIPAPTEEVAQTHNQWLASPAWIIDGWGSWATIRARFDLADTIVVVDFPLALHYWWAIKRQVTCMFQSNPAWPPPGCRALPVTWRLLKMIWQIHWIMRPKLLELVARYHHSSHVVYVRSPHQLQELIRSVLQKR
jgi:hypothetical protein